MIREIHSAPAYEKPREIREACLFMGTEGIEPSRLSAHDPKSCLSASSSTSTKTRQIIADSRRLWRGWGVYIVRNQDMIRKWMDAFIRDCRVRDLSAHTVAYYRAQLAAFETFASAQAVIEVTEITPDLIRGYLLDLEAQGANPGGRHAKYRGLRAWLLWYEREAEPPGWKNPIAKVKPPKVTSAPIEGVTIETVRAILATCNDNFIGRRDYAIILFLLDSGARAGELLALDLSDVDTISGSVLIRMGKGRKPRTVFIGRKSRRATRRYLSLRDDNSPALWVTSSGERLAVSSLQGMLQRRAKAAGVDTPSPHDFRRAFALAMLRAGTDVFTLQRLLGHTTLEVLRRYLAQSAEDLQQAHERAGIVDRIF